MIILHYENYENYCDAFGSLHDTEVERALLLLCLKSPYIQTLQFDPLSGEILPMGLVDLVENITEHAFASGDSDALTQLVNRFSNTFYHIKDNMGEQIVRENALMPISKVRQVNSVSVHWLSKRTGRTVREKLSQTNVMLGVRQYMSTDTGENRLFCALVSALVKQLSQKIDSLPLERIAEEERDFYNDLLLFHRGDVPREIGQWQNTAPNNTLLSNRYYNRAWITWQSLNHLDDVLQDDEKKILHNLTRTFFLYLLAQFNEICRVPQVLVEFSEESMQMSLFREEIRFVMAGHPMIEGVLYCKGTSEDGGLLSSVVCELGGRTIAIEFYDGVDNTLLINPDSIFVGILDVEEDKLLELSEMRVEMFSNIVEVAIDYIFEGQISEPIEVANQEVFPTAMQKAVIDLYAVRPQYMASNGKIFQFEEKLLLLEYESGGVVHQISNGHSDAIVVGATDYQVISIRTLLKEKKSTTQKIDIKNKENRIRHLAQEVKRTLPVKTLACIILDVLMMRELVHLRNALQFSYKKVLPFPRSMGLIFHWQNSHAFQQLHISEQPIYALVTDFVGEDITLTLVRGTKNEKFAKAISETQGIMWERFPTKTFPCEKYIEAVKSVLHHHCGLQSNVKIKEVLTLLDLFGVEGLITECNRLSVDFGEQWLHIGEGLVRDLENIKMDISEIRAQYLLEMNFTEAVHTLIASPLQSDQNNRKIYDAMQGYFVYEKWKKQAESVGFLQLLWQDFIPSLAIKRLYGRLELLENVQIEPEFGKSQKFGKLKHQIPLEANKKVFEFPLLIGDGNKEAQYIGKLVFDAPLAQEVLCDLELQYTYGEEMPYKMTLLPENKKNAPFLKKEVSFEELHYTTEGLEIPQFPVALTWDELERNRNPHTGKYRDVIREFEQLFSDIQEMMMLDVEKVDFRLHSYFGRDRSGFCFQFIPMGFGDVEVFVHQKNFLEGEFSSSGMGEMYGLLRQDTTSRRISDRRLVCITKDENKLGDRYSRYLYSLGEGKRIFGKLYLFYIIFKNGRRVEGTPIQFQNAVRKGAKLLLEVYQNTKNGQMRSFAFTACGFLYAALEEVESTDFYAELMVFVEECCRRKGKSIVGNRSDFDMKTVFRSMGNLQNESQQKLFVLILKYFTKEKSMQGKLIEFFATTMWSAKEAVFAIYQKKPELLLELLANATEFLSNIEELIRLGDNNGQRSKKIARYLEFVLAVFRLRELDYKRNQDLHEKLSMNNVQIRQLYVALEEMPMEWWREIDKEMYVEVSVDKPTHYNGVHDLLYTMLVYITGEVSEIQIVTRE